MDFPIVRRKVDPERNADHVVGETRSAVVIYHVFRMIGKVNHSFQIQMLFGVCKDTVEHFIGVGQRDIIVIVRIIFGNIRGFSVSHGDAWSDNYNGCR